LVLPHGLIGSQLRDSTKSIHLPPFLKFSNSRMLEVHAIYLNEVSVKFQKL